MLIAEQYTRLFGLDPQLLFDASTIGLSVLVLSFFMGYLLFNPVRKILQDRSDRIAKDIKDAETDKDVAAKLKAEYEAKLRDVDKEAETILAEARQKAIRQEAKIIEGAKEEAFRITKRAQQEAELEKKRAMDEMKQEVIQIASLMASKVVAANIDTSIQNELIDATLREMGDSTWRS
ncbi:F0F1 ATP synthase subunit B [Lachnobacterium bovis]|uniref:ATP synthase subunit b n=1 Tax=Lachnobacterium bovis TaxID=140626 RepID=A0A1H9TY70_9FIRM|nr:F0F1 ATP synthase subunit B [Lachnobacterium bovis]SES02205.1 F-type H+-transporting ATPase subunit b [Lachnobacterium bovis]